MRVALVNVTTTTKIGGVETFVWQLAQSLAGRGISVTVFGGAGAHGPLLEATPGVSVVTTPYVDRTRLRRVPGIGRQYGMTKLIERLSYGAAAQRQIADGAFDIIHIHKPFDFPLVAWLRRRTSARIIYSSHGRDFFPGDGRFAKAVDLFTACSAYNAAEVEARYGRDAIVIYNGIDTAQFAPRPPDRAWLPAGVTVDGPLLLWVGRLERWKGTIDAVRALALLPGAVHLAIVGSGPEASRLKDAAQSLGIAHRVHFTGALPHETLARVYAAAAVVLGTSFANETFGMTLAEASACARPIIATRFGGFPEVVRDGVTGLLVPPRQPPAMAAAVQGLLSDPEQARAMGEAGRAFVTAHFAWPVVTDRVLAVY